MAAGRDANRAATGGTTPPDGDERSIWVASPGTARVLVVATIATPAVAGALAAAATGWLLGRPVGTVAMVGWWAAVGGVAVAALVVAGRAAARLRPLATLYRLSLTFPGVAPSRWQVSGRDHRAPAPAEVTETEAASHLLALVVALDAHSRTGRGHAMRVAAYADLVAADLGIPTEDRERLRWAALLHDVGKLDIRPATLDRQPPPPHADLEVLHRHVPIAEQLAAPLGPWLGDWSGGIVQHHERPDGRGYPAGLRGDQIGTAGRIIAVADAYDAMTSPRSYGSARTPAEAAGELLRHRGTQFDADVVRALLHVPADQRRQVAGPVGLLVRFRAAGRLAAAIDRPAVPAVGAVAFAAVVAVATLSGLALPGPATSGSTAGASPTTRVTPSPADPGEPGKPGVPSTTDSPDGGAAGDPTGGSTAPDDQAGITTTTESGEPPAGTSSTTGTDEAPGTTTTEPPAAPPSSTPPTTGTTTTTTPPNAPPVAAADAESVTILSTTTIDVLGNDRDDTGLDPASLRITSLPGAGSASVVGGRIRYMAPLLGESAEVGYRVCDVDGACTTAVLTITIRVL